MKKLIRKLLYKNLSKAQLIGFTLSNLAGLAIVILGLQFWQDARSIWEDEDSFIRKDYLVINKKVTSANTLGESTSFTPDQIKDLESQPWVRKVGKFTAADYRISAYLQQGGRSMQSAMFLEAIPTDFIDVADGKWHFNPDEDYVPLIVSKDYLSLYNFGFAGTVGMSQFSENTISSVPLVIHVRPDNGQPDREFTANIVGFSNRLNTILVPQEFMDWSNASFSTHTEPQAPSRLIVDVSSPGDVKIAEYMEAHDYEIAGDKSGSQASYLVKVIVGVALTVGVIITLLSFFILLLSISLLMQKNRAKIHSLIMLGTELRSISAVYIRVVVGINLLAFLLAAGAMFLFRGSYLASIKGMGAESGQVWLPLAIGLGITLIMTLCNSIFIIRKVHRAFLNA